MEDWQIELEQQGIDTTLLIIENEIYGKG